MNNESTINSQTWRQHFRPHVNGVRVSWAELQLDIMTGTSCRLELEYEESWMIGAPDKPGARICLEYRNGQEGQGLLFNPPLGELVEMADGTKSLTWTIEAVEAPSSLFALEFSIPEFSDLPKSDPVVVSYFNLQQDLDVRFDVFPAFFGETAYPCHGALHTITITPRPETHLLGKKVQLVTTEDSLGATLMPTSEQVLISDGIKWELNCRSTSQNGVLELIFLLCDSKASSLPLAMNLGHNLVTAKRWSTGPHYAWPDMTYYVYYIGAESVFLKSPAPNVPVSVHGKPPGRVTDHKGELSLRGEPTAATFSIVNMYDGSRV